MVYTLFSIYYYFLYAQHIIKQINHKVQVQCRLSKPLRMEIALSHWTAMESIKSTKTKKVRNNKVNQNILFLTFFVLVDFIPTYLHVYIPMFSLASLSYLNIYVAYP